MELQIVFIVIGSICAYWLWSKIEYLNKKLETSRLTTILRIAPLWGESKTFFEHPLILELLDIKSTDDGKRFKDYPEKTKESIRKFYQDNRKKLHLSFRFFFDKELVFTHLPDGDAVFLDFPRNDEVLYRETLGETKDRETVEYIIKYRVLEEQIRGMNVSVFTGYLRKSSDHEAEKAKIAILFDFPQAFIDPRFFDNISREDLKEMKRLLEHKCNLYEKEDVDFTQFEGDLGETEYFTGLGKWHENEYFSFKY